MEAAFLAMAAFLVANILAGLSRVMRGPSPPDRMAAAQLFGTFGVGILLILAEVSGRPGLRDVALVFALLGGVATIAFVARVWRRLDGGR